MSIHHLMKKHITNIPGPTEDPAHDQFQRIDTEFQGKETKKLHHVTGHTPVTVGKVHRHPEQSIGRNLQPDHAHDQYLEGVTVTRILKVFQRMFFTAKMAQDHDRDPNHITGQMTNIETLLQRLSWQRGGVRDQDRHWHPVHGIDRHHYPIRHPPHGTENFRKISTLLVCVVR